MNALNEFVSAIASAGLTPPADIIADGKIHRFASNGKRDDDAGWYVFHPDHPPAGAFGDWRTGINETWQANGAALSEADRDTLKRRWDAAKQQREADERTRHEEAAVRARALWERGAVAQETHPYLTKKGIKAHGLRVTKDGALMVPVCHADGELMSLQFIPSDGGKKFLSGGATGGGYHVIGDPGTSGPLCIAEGFATAASVHEATGYPTVIAFSASNLVPVAKVWRERCPDRAIVVCSDDDYRTEGNTGLTKATEAARSIGGVVAVPAFGADRPDGATDFNDLAGSHGPDAVREAVNKAVNKACDQATLRRDADTVDTSAAPWPALDAAAYHGLAGDAVRLLDPHTEADPVALLVSFLAEAGTILNRGPHLVLDGCFHPLLFWPVLVGQSSKSRKGTAGKRIESLLKSADPNWTRGHCKGNLSSGEGLCYAVRDAEYKEEALKDHGRPTGETVTICVDAGVDDKRLFLVQAEFGAVLRVMAREGNSLSGVLREAWDGLDLAPMTKNNRIKATTPHIGIASHVTQDELRRNLTDTEASNGFGNRFVWIAVKKSKELPFSSTPDEQAMRALAGRIGKALQYGRTVGQIGLTDKAREVWRAVYHDLSADRPGMAGALLGRAEAQVMRLAALYAVLDGRGDIDLAHLRAALALWEYAEKSTAMIFGDSTGDPVADTILKAVRASGKLCDSQISDLFGRHVSASRLAASKNTLQATGMIHSEMTETGGRPRIVWCVGAKKAKDAK